MEQKNNVTNADYFNNFASKEKHTYDGQIFNKSCIKKYHSKSNILNPKKNEINTMTINNESKKKQKQIKQCFYDLIKTKEQKEKNIRKDCIAITNTEEGMQKPITITNNINKTELKNNKFGSKIKNIKVNKIKIEKINKENDIKINSNTNRNFYQKSSKDFNLFSDEKRNANNYLSDFRPNENNENNEKNEKNLRRTNMISVKSFNKSAKDSALINGHLQNSEFINYMNPFNNKDNNDFSLSNKNNKYNMSTNTYSHTTDGKSKISNSSKIIISFKNIKTIYAHFEIFLSLYLKRIFKFFIEKLNIYEKPKNMGNNIQLQQQNVYSEGNNYRPILNVNNVQCSLYNPINLNQDKLFSTIYDSQYLNSTLSPLMKTNEFVKGGEIINKRNRLLFVEPDCNMNLSTNKRSEKVNNKSVYIPKKKISKSKTDLFNELNQKKSKINIKQINNFNHKLKSSPIKEMNINLRQINMSKINNLNPNTFKDNNGNFAFLEISPIIKINNNTNITNHSKYNSNNIYTINPSSNNLSKEKNKLKKFQSAKNGVYIKPKEKNKKSKIKEIKINKKLSPLRKEIEYHRRYNNIKTDNISTVDSTFFKNKYLKDINKTKDINMYTINQNNEQSTIKKIYINRNSKNKTSNNFNLKEKILDSYQKQFYSNYLEYKSENKKNNNNNNNEILIANFVTPDKRVFINEKYMIINNNNYIKRNKNLCLTLNLDIENQFSISIVNNIINESKEINNILLYKLNNNKINILDIYSFDDNKKEKTPEVIKTKNICFFFKDHTITKGESIIDLTINEDLCNFINILKNNIIKRIRKFIYIIFKRKIILMKLLKKKDNKIINFYFSKLKYNNKSSNVQFISDKNNHGIYHKINYNDDYNLNKRLKTPKNFKKNINVNNPHCKTKPYNLNCYNGINQHNSKKKLDRKRSNEKISLNLNYKSINKYINKEMNICVHNNTNTNNNNKSNIDEIKKIKNKIFSLRIKLIISTLKKAKNAL